MTSLKLRIEDHLRLEGSVAAGTAGVIEVAALAGTVDRVETTVLVLGTTVAAAG